ncbi:MAG: acyl carrier protein [Holophagales bacterium]|nr:acyl carrier protein [Holophagales bacterium]MYD20697.1 acyl carrier protein [Holophagales bacterium]MYI33977.1 acyl carrier protein [Holophagales bacterium]
MTRDEIKAKLTGFLVEMYELEPDQVTLNSRLYEDLALDSIDAVDLIVRLKEFTQADIAPERVKEIRTVEDVVDLVAELLQVK